MRIPVVTVDGPSGVGKGSLCREIAKRLRWHVLDSGAMYRALVLFAMYYQISLRDEKKLAMLAANFDINRIVNLNKLKFFLEGKEVKLNIRNETIGELASNIAVFPKIREVLLYRQRSFQRLPGLIADGRDMGTVVFPNALIKFFLDASFEERSKRRILQLQKTEFNVNLNSLTMKIKQRDNRDRNRSISPLIPAVDALIVNSTDVPINKLTDRIVNYIMQLL